MTEGRAAADADGIRSLERGLALLEAMNRNPHASVTTLARQIGVPRSTTYRLLDTLAAAGYVATQPGVRGYRLTREVRRLSDGFLDDEWLDRAWPLLLALGDSIIWPVSLFTQEAATMVIRRTTHEHSVMSIDYGMTGRRMPITETAAGRAYLAFCPAAERDLILALPQAFEASDARIERDILEGVLEKTRRQGFGTRVGGVIAKTASISVPVMRDARVLCCISVIWFASGMSVDQAIGRFAAPLQRCAATVALMAADIPSIESTRPS